MLLLPILVVWLRYLPGADGLSFIHPAGGANRSLTSISEGATTGTAVDTIIAEGTGTVTYAIWTQTGSGACQINSATGAITVINGSAIDYETSSDFFITLNVSDVKTSIQGTLIVGLTDINDCAPQFEPWLTNSTLYIPHGSGEGALLTILNATDADGTTSNNQITGYSIVSGNFDNTFTISNTSHVTVASGQVTNMASTAEFYMVVKVTDSGSPQLTGTTTLHIIVCTDCPESKSPVIQPLTSLLFVLIFSHYLI